MLLRSLLFFSLLLPVYGQSAPAQGVATEWEARKQIEELKLQLLKIPTELNKLDTKRWLAAGAPGAYLDDLENSRRQLNSLGQALDELRQTPEKLAVALEILLRMSATDESLRIVVEAVRKYENPAVADLLEAKMGETMVAKDKFRRYLIDLAGERDRQLEVLLKEAQRCRTESNMPKTPVRPAAPAVKK